MHLDNTAVRSRLREFDFPALFTQDLGWDKHSATFDVTFNGQGFVLSAIAEKRGMVALHCPCPAGMRLPDYPTRCKVEQQITRFAHEHLLIFTDPSRSLQIWQWVKREAGKPLARREHHYHTSQSGDSLIQKLQNIAFSLDEEEGLTLVDVTTRAGAGFDIERVTKRFYERFKKEHAVFLDFIEGIGEVADRQWYASLMLNRLMFVYFVQKKGFLDGDLDYLRNRLARTREEHGKNKFYSFYRYFLIRLFHEGLGRKARTAELEKLLGKIPYFNGGMFEPHEIERRFPEIHIPDNAFKRIFDYFDEYQWHLDERPLRDDREINPDVLGYIFEKYINQKEMGAYYTKEDITEYISKNTVLPFLFDAARAKCKVAFENPGGPTVWDLLKANPDRYIYPAVRHGLTWNCVPDHPAKGEPLAKPLELPAEIAAGLDTGKPRLLERRQAWNKPAPSEYALPTEIWREVVGRRQRCAEIRQKLAAGEVRDVNDLVTLNLDIRQFAQDVIQNCEGPDLLRALWRAIEKITILDPTCGSGAFLFAALNILEPLYEGCLGRMESFLQDESRNLNPEDLARTPHGYPVLPKGKFEDFSRLLDRVADHPSQRYFTLKSIILNNLFGVDIMEEATEICKLRLFLKLAAQVDPDPAKENFGVEPLPDIDFNIRAGNTLVGYATAEEVRCCMKAEKTSGADQMRLGVAGERGAYAEFEDEVLKVDAAFRSFRQQQTELGGTVTAEDKRELQKRLTALEAKLNGHLARDYRVKTADENDYARWLGTHQPFHWLVEFYGTISNGGFDVIIGNPPYVEIKALERYRVRGYRCEDAGNLYALVIERCDSIGRRNGRQGFIVPVSSVSTDRYAPLQELLLSRGDHFSSYDDRPSRLFDGLEHIRLTIHILGRLAQSDHHFSTRYNKWSAEERASLFGKLVFAASRPALVRGTLPKLCLPIELSIIQKLAAQQRSLSAFYSRTTPHHVFYSRKVGYFLQVLDFEPEVLDGNGERRPPSEFKELTFASADYARLALCSLNSTLFYWFTTVFSDCRHVNKREVDTFPVNLEALATGPARQELDRLAGMLMDDLKSNSVNRTMTFQHDTLTVQCIYPKSSKRILDQIDAALGHHYGFTPEELDFILNYDVKYRVGNVAETGEEDQ
jgi:hypothetical protein